MLSASLCNLMRKAIGLAASWHGPGTLHLNCTTVIEWAGRINGRSGDQAPSNGATVTASGLPGMLMSPSAAPWMRQAGGRGAGLVRQLQFQRDRLRGE